MASGMMEELFDYFTGRTVAMFKLTQNSAEPNNEELEITFVDGNILRLATSSPEFESHFVISTGVTK